MKLEVINEQVERTYSNGKKKERLTSIQFSIVDDDGAVIGDASVGDSYVNMNLNNMSGFDSIDEGVSKLSSIFGIEK